MQKAIGRDKFFPGRSPQQATKVVKCGRTFVAWLYATAAKIREMFD